THSLSITASRIAAEPEVSLPTSRFAMTSEPTSCDSHAAPVQDHCPMIAPEPSVRNQVSPFVLPEPTGAVVEDVTVFLPSAVCCACWAVVSAASAAA